MKALPTFFLVILVHFYLKHLFFRPLERVLDARYAATEGARKQAEEMLAKASSQAAEFEAAMRAARAGVYQAQEQLHRRLQEQRAADVAAARARAQAMIEEARSRLAAEVAQAKAGLARESEFLANKIAEVILNRSAA